MRDQSRDTKHLKISGILKKTEERNSKKMDFPVINDHDTLDGIIRIWKKPGIKGHVMLV